MPNLYATVAALDERLGGQTTGQESMLLAILDAVSRQIDHWTGRHFFSQVATKTFSPTRPDCLLVPDLLAVTSLASDSSSDQSYATSWETSDYLLLPFDAAQQSPPHPYWEVRLAPSGAQSFTPGLATVQIAGRWGFYDVVQPSGATLDGPLAPSQTTVQVQGGSNALVGQTVRIDDEQILITAVVGNTITVDRGVNGTTAAAHDPDTAIDVYTYPIISEICLLQAAHLYQSTQAPGGVIGSTDFGPIRFTALQPLARSMLQSFRLPGLASYAN